MKKVLTVMLDGFGVSDDDTGNSVKQAEMRHFNALLEKYPNTLLHASGKSIGLQENEAGNCAYNNMLIGTGRIVPSNSSKVSNFLEEDYNNNEVFQKLLSNNKKRVHLIGLCSDGNVYGNINHLIKLLTILANKNFKSVFIHVITDGRDSLSNTAYSYINMLNSEINKIGVGSIATICGRIYAMDKNDNFDRTKRYYDLITKGVGTGILNIEPAINTAYHKGFNDENMPPYLVNQEGIVRNGDIVIWTNFRNDRSKQILGALSDSKFAEFETIDLSKCELYTFIPLESLKRVNGFLKKQEIDTPLGIYLSKLGIKQARIAETEKYSMATYYFDGGFSGKLDNCDKFKIASPNEDEYTNKPELSSVAITKKIIECMEQDYDFIYANYANLDTLGHTGNIEATTRGCMAIDLCLEQLIEAAEENFYTLILISDHGNVEKMLNSDGTINKYHTTSKVPFIITDSKIKLRKDMSIVSIAPTILDYLDISIPSSMTEESIIEK